MTKWNCNWWDYPNKKDLQKMVKLTICGVCLKKPKDKQLHHITYFCDCGLNEVENLCYLCSECHKKLHRQDNSVIRKIKFRKKLMKLKKEGLI